MGKKCSLKVLGDNGKTLHGNSAVLHYLSEQGGWDAFVAKLSYESAQVAVDHAFREMRKASFTSVKGKKSS